MVEIKFSIRAGTTGDVSVLSTSGGTSERTLVPFFDGPFTAPAPPAGPPDPPESLGKRAPFLQTILAESDPPQPAIRDFSYQWNRPLGAWGGRMSHWVDWTDADSRLVEAALTPAVVRELENTIQRWVWMWPDVAATLLPARHPDFIAELNARRKTDSRFRRKRKAHERDWLDTALHEGLFEVFRARGRWPSPEAQNCSVCGRLFAPETLSHWMRRFGPPRYCAACCCRATQGCSVGDRFLINESLRFAAKALRCIPSQDYVHGDVDLGGLDAAGRDDAMVALVCFPDPAAAATALAVSTTGRGRWLAVLQAVGLVGAAWRQARGTCTFASDGHLCRSLGERSIDDFFSANNRACPVAC